MPREDGPFEVLEKMNDNAYKVDLLGDYWVSATFNIADLSTYQADDYLDDLRIKSSQQGEDDRVPLSQDIEEGTKSLARYNASSKVQPMAHNREKSHKDATRLKGQKIPHLFHLIS